MQYRLYCLYTVVTVQLSTYQLLTTNKSRRSRLAMNVAVALSYDKALRAFCLAKVSITFLKLTFLDKSDSKLKLPKFVSCV